MICSEATFNITEAELKVPGFKYANAIVMGDAS
jgi:hypothetical protein